MKRAGLSKVISDSFTIWAITMNLEIEKLRFIWKVYDLKYTDSRRWISWLELDEGRGKLR